MTTHIRDLFLPGHIYTVINSGAVNVNDFINQLTGNDIKWSIADGFDMGVLLDCAGESHLGRVVFYDWTSIPSMEGAAQRHRIAVDNAGRNVYLNNLGDDVAMIFFVNGELKDNYTKCRPTALLFTVDEVFTLTGETLPESDPRVILSSGYRSRERTQRKFVYDNGQLTAI